VRLARSVRPATSRALIVSLTAFGRPLRRTLTRRRLPRTVASRLPPADTTIVRSRRRAGALRRIVTVRVDRQVRDPAPPWPVVAPPPEPPDPPAGSTSATAAVGAERTVVEPPALVAVSARRR